MSTTNVTNNRPMTAPMTTTYLRSSSQAREVTRGFLASLTSPPTPETTDTALLVVSELVTNAIKHAGGITEFRLDASAHILNITVGDPSSALPQERTPDLSGHGEGGGFGWPLIRRLTSELSIDLGSRHTKRIRAAVPM